MGEVPPESRTTAVERPHEKEESTAFFERNTAGTCAHESGLSVEGLIDSGWLWEGYHESRRCCPNQWARKARDRARKCGAFVPACQHENSRSTRMRQSQKLSSYTTVYSVIYDSGSVPE